MLRLEGGWNHSISPSVSQEPEIPARDAIWYKSIIMKVQHGAKWVSTSATWGANDKTASPVLLGLPLALIRAYGIAYTVWLWETEDRAGEKVSNIGCAKEIKGNKRKSKLKKTSLSSKKRNNVILKAELTAGSGVDRLRYCLSPSCEPPKRKKSVMGTEEVLEQF